MRQDATNKTIPITVRALETMIRLSTAHAKLKLRTEVSQEDVDVAFDLMQYALYARSKDKYEEAHRQRKRQRTSQPGETAGAGAAGGEGAPDAAAASAGVGAGQQAGQPQEQQADAGAGEAEGAAAAGAGGLTEEERERVFAAYRTCSLQDEYSSTVSLQEIEALCPAISRQKIVQAVNELKDQNKCGPIDPDTNEIYKL